MGESLSSKHEALCSNLCAAKKKKKKPKTQKKTVNAKAWVQMPISHTQKKVGEGALKWPLPFPAPIYNLN
jgi:hypothetical protein